MSPLFLRTLSQGLQAFMPIAAALVWCRARGSAWHTSAVRRGLIASIPLSIVGAELFRASSHQALDEALLAVTAILITLFSARLLATPSRDPDSRTDQVSSLRVWAVAAAASLLVVRQTMEIVATLTIAATEVRSVDATAAIVSGAAAAAFAAWLGLRLGRRLGARPLFAAMRTFWACFLAQATIYAFHELAEARLLPWSDVLHAATEPYSPDGIYGVHFSDSLVVAPPVAAAIVWAGDRLRADPFARWRTLVRRRAAIVSAALAACLLIGLQQSDARAPQTTSRASAQDLAAALAHPHVLFRNTAPGPDYAALSVVALDAPGGVRRSTGLTCERLSFAGGRGLCLHLQRGVFNTYTAVLLDGTLAPGLSLKLQGLPSRTRTSADGQLGATTVFVIGDDYAAEFSTRTTLVDLSSGDDIGELEQFSTWRDGARIRAADFNFWGVTFARDGRTFYAALRTAGKTYLVRGELALRRLTVLRENVECPSLSPDDRLLAYKKRVGPGPDTWRLHVLDLQSGVERIVPGEERYIDDQVEWLDARHLLYGVRRRTTAISDVWVASVDGDEPARVFIPEAESPAVVR